MPFYVQTPRNSLHIFVVPKRRRWPILDQKSARFPCENANLPHCTYFTQNRGGDLHLASTRTGAWCMPKSSFAGGRVFDFIKKGYWPGFFVPVPALFKLAATCTRDSVRAALWNDKKGRVLPIFSNILLTGNAVFKHGGSSQGKCPFLSPPKSPQCDFAILGVGNGAVLPAFVKENVLCIRQSLRKFAAIRFSNVLSKSS